MAWGDGYTSKQPRKDGRYQGALRIEGRRVTVYGKTQREVRKKLADLRRDRDAGRVPSSDRTTVADYLAEWLESKRDGLKPRAYERYEQLCRVQIEPAIGAKRLALLGPRDVQRMYADLGTSVAPQTVLHVHRALHAALAQALRWGLVERNVAALVNAPRVPRHEARVLTAEEATRLLSASASDRLDALYVLALTTGMRAGELCGLRWQDVDLPAGVVTVRVALVYVNRELSLAPTKTDKPRAIPLTELAQEAMLRRWDIYNDERQAAAHAKPRGRGETQLGVWKEHGVCFPLEDGSYLSPKAFRVRFEALMRQAGITDLTPHELRHTAATFLLGAGVNLKAVSGLLGHSRVGITADRYAALTPEMLEGARDAMQRLLGGG